MLLTAPELINASSSYNEILILEQGYKPHEIDKDTIVTYSKAIVNAQR